MNGHFDAFHELEHEKQERIINAALEELTRKGFKKASTNVIVEKAGISKGTLFYYFGSKEELFDFLCDYTIEFAKREYVNKFEQQANTGDFIERYKVLSEIKRYAVTSNPQIIKFYESFFYPENAEYFAKYNQTIQEIRSHVFNNLYENIDYSLFIDSVEPEKIVTYIKWLMDRYEKDLTDRYEKDLTDRYEKDLTDKLQENAQNSLFSESTDIIMGEKIEKAFDKFYDFLDDLRKIFYK